jgi:hypothetical protein
MTFLRAVTRGALRLQAEVSASTTAQQLENRTK